MARRLCRRLLTRDPHSRPMASVTRLPNPDASRSLWRTSSKSIRTLDDVFSVSFRMSALCGTSSAYWCTKQDARDISSESRCTRSNAGPTFARLFRISMLVGRHLLHVIFIPTFGGLCLWHFLISMNVERRWLFPTANYCSRSNPRRHSATTIHMQSC